MKYKIAFLTSLLLLVMGCSENPIRKMVVECSFPDQPSPQGPALVSQDYGSTSPIPLNAVQFVSPSLLKQLAVQNLTARRNSVQTVEINARFINCSDYPMVVGVRAHFMDSDQVLVEKETAWKNVIIQPYALGAYKETSIKKDVGLYLLEVRDAR